MYLHILNSQLDESFQDGGIYAKKFVVDSDQNSHQCFDLMCEAKLASTKTKVITNNKKRRKRR